MSPEKATVIFRDGWDPICSQTFSKEERFKAMKSMEDVFFRDFGIKLDLEKLTLVDLYS